MAVSLFSFKPKFTICIYRQFTATFVASLKCSLKLSLWFNCKLPQPFLHFLWFFLIIPVSSWFFLLIAQPASILSFNLKNQPKMACSKMATLVLLLFLKIIISKNKVTKKSAQNISITDIGWNYDFTNKENIRFQNRTRSLYFPLANFQS